MSNRAIYTIMAIVALAAIGGLYWMVQGGGDEPEAVAKTQPAGSAGSGFTGAGHGPAGSSPALPKATGTPGELPAKVQEYAANGAIIRDHRTGSNAPFEADPNAQAPNARKLQPTLTKEIADRVRDAVHECVTTLPANQRGVKGRIEGTINIAIKAKQVSVTKAALNIKDVAADVAETTRQCVEQKSLAITQAAADEEDLASYDITVSLNLI